MRTDDDELEGWMERPAEGTPLAALARARLEAMPVDEAEVKRVTDRALARLQGPHTREAGVRQVGTRWRAPLLGTVLALAAGLAFALWPRPPDRPEIEWTVHPAPLGAVSAEVQATEDPEALAAAWLEAGRPADAAAIYRWLLARDPAGPDAARWQHALALALAAAGDREGAWTETLALRDRYGPGSTWASHWGAQPGDLVTDILKDQALYWHKTGMKGDPALLERAGVAYEMYLADLPSGPDDADMRYAYGELLYRIQRLDEAWEQYRVVAQRHPDSRHAKFCAESAVFAAEKLAAEHPGDQTLGLWEERYVQSVDAMGDLWVDDPRLMAHEYRVAWLLGQRGQGAEAREHFDRVIALEPESREASLAATLIVDTLVAEGAWGPLVVRAQSWLDAGWPDDELRATLLEALAEADRHEPVP